MRPLMLLAALCGLAACSGTQTLMPVESGATPAFDPSTQGIVVGSSMFTGYYEGELKTFPGGVNLGEGFRCSSYSAYYYGLGGSADGEVGDFSAIPDTKLLSQIPVAPYDYDVDQGHGSVHATIVPAGRYELSLIAYYCNDTSYTLSEFRVPFEVLPGQVHYAGEIQYIHQFGKSFLNTPRFDFALVRFEDQRERDLPLLHEKYPFLKAYPVTDLDFDWKKIYTAPAGD